MGRVFPGHSSLQFGDPCYRASSASHHHRVSCSECGPGKRSIQWEKLNRSRTQDATKFPQKENSKTNVEVCWLNSQRILKERIKKILVKCQCVLAYSVFAQMLYHQFVCIKWYVYIFFSWFKRPFGDILRNVIREMMKKKHWSVVLCLAWTRQRDSGSTPALLTMVSFFCQKSLELKPACKQQLLNGKHCLPQP